MAIQDRQFDTTGQLFFPDGSGADAATSNLNGTPPNPLIHPFWIPEFVGDVVVVNGAPWPYLNVEPKRYRFRLLDGSNARAYNLKFGTAPTYVIATDDNYLDAPVLDNRVFMMPGQRRDVIVDFTAFAGTDCYSDEQCASSLPCRTFSCAVCRPARVLRGTVPC